MSVTLTVGETYNIGTFIDVDNNERTATWICAKDLGNGNYAMQSTGLSYGYWAGYVNNNGYYNSSFSYTDIHGLTSSSNFDVKHNLSNWYTTWRGIESLGGVDNAGEYSAENSKNGLYLIPRNKATDYYLEGLKSAGENDYLDGENDSWTGSLYSALEAYAVHWDGDLTNLTQATIARIAPVFNIDTEKISLNGSTILKYNYAPVITSDTTSLGVKDGTFDIAYVVSDENSDTITGVFKLDGTVFDTANDITLNETQLITITSSALSQMSVGTHTITIEVSDGVATTTKDFTFTRADIIFIDRKTILSKQNIVDLTKGILDKVDDRFGDYNGGAIYLMIDPDDIEDLPNGSMYIETE